MIALVCFVGTLAASADAVKGRVVNAETGEPISMAIAKEVISFTNGGSYEDFAETDSAGCFVLDAPREGRLIMAFSMIGYKTHRKVSYVYGRESKDTLDMGDIKLQPTALMLQEVEVKAKVPRITMSGDTIVFNPSAFKMQDGDRLAELISKLPGVQRSNGKLMWHGKQIRLMVNGKDMFGGDEIIGQLPAEAAGKIKVYNRKSELARHTGKDEGEEDHVLDIQIKPSFLDKWYGELEASYVTADHYLGKLQAYNINEKNPHILYFKANDINQKTEREDGRWVNGSVDKFGKDMFGAYNFEHNWTTKGAEDYGNNHFDISASLGHADGYGTDYYTKETFFPNSDHTFTLSRNSSNSHSLKPQLQMDLFAYTDRKNSVKVNVLASYEKSRTLMETDGVNYVEDAALSRSIDGMMSATQGSSLYDRIVTRNRYYNSSEKETRKLVATYDWKHYIGSVGMFQLGGSTTVLSEDNEDNYNRSLEYVRDNRSEHLWQLADSPSQSVKTRLKASLSYWLSNNVYLGLSDALTYTNGHDRRHFFSDEKSAGTEGGKATSPDPSNSMNYNYRQLMNTMSLTMMFRLSKNFSLTPSLDWHVIRDHGDMVYGRLDSTAVRTKSLLAPSATMKWKIDRQRNMNLSFEYYQQIQPMFKTFAWRDSRDPMMVVLGSGELSNEGMHVTKYTYNRLWLRQQISMSLEASYSKSINPVTSVYHYDTSTGVYERKNVNVRGGDQYRLALNYDQGIGVYMQLKNNAAASWGTGYGYMTQVDDDIALRLNRERLFVFTDNLSLSYEAEKVRTSVFGSVQLNRYRYTDEVYNCSPLYLEYGADVYLKLQPFTLSARLWDEFRSGYSSEGMNRHRLMSRASVAYSFCKNKCRLSLTAQDIFNQGRTFVSKYNAYERTEQWYESFHHYLQVSFAYRFDAKAKKR